MRFQVSEICPDYHFEIMGMSYIGNPKDQTCLFITGKIKEKIENLRGHRHCLVFVDQTVVIPEEIAEANCFVVTDQPASAYGRFAVQMRKAEEEEQKSRSYTLMPGGYYLGENIALGKNVRIEPNCLLDHDVTIGDDAYIGTGSIIRHAMIGKRFQCHEHTVIGTESFNMADDQGVVFRVPSFGSVRIGDHVDLGANVIIERGYNSDTVIGDYTKIDSDVCIGHDVELGAYVTITCGTCLAGRVKVESHSYIGMNATVKQRITIEEGATVGMGSAVISDVKAGTSVFGNPSRKFSF